MGAAPEAWVSERDMQKSTAYLRFLWVTKSLESFLKAAKVGWYKDLLSLCIQSLEEKSGQESLLKT